MEYDDRVMCPLIDEKIDPMECVDVVDCVLNPLFLNSLPEKYKAKEKLRTRTAYQGSRLAGEYEKDASAISIYAAGTFHTRSVFHITK